MNMPALDVDREQVRMLVRSVGCTEAARQTGINLNTILAWSARGGWLKADKPTAPHLIPRAIPAIIAPADALDNVLADDERETKLGLSRLVRNSVTRAESVPVETAQDAHAIGKLAGLVHKWESKDQSITVALNLGFFGSDAR